MIPPDPLITLTQAQIVGLTLFGEARGEPIEGRFAVANVIRNRVQAQRPKYGLTYRDVCLKAWQFSCWLPQGGAENYALVLDMAQKVSAQAVPLPAMLQECLWIGGGLLGSIFGDTVHAATHYYSPAAMTPAGSVPPWAKGLQPVCTIHHHLFFAGVK